MVHSFKRYALCVAMGAFGACAEVKNASDPNTPSPGDGNGSAANGSGDEGGIVVSDGTNEAIQALTMIDAAEIVGAASDSSGTRSVVRDVAVADDYSAAQGRFYVRLEATEALNMLNMILCFSGQFKAEHFVNQGPYIAEVNQAECQKSAGQQAGPEEEQGLIPVVVDVTRVDNASPQVLHAWVPSGEEGPSAGDTDEYIEVEARVTESPSAEKPFGAFTLAWHMPGGYGGGYIRAGVTNDGKPTFTLVDIESGREYGDSEYTGPVTVLKRVGVVKNADGVSGLAKTSVSTSDQTHTNIHHYLLGYDGDHIALREQDTSSCLDRHNYSTKVWRYGLYHADTGREVTLEGESNLSFKVPCNGGSVRAGMSYYGSWIENEQCVLRDGDVFQEEKNDRRQQSSARWFTFHTAQGKLARVTPFFKNLADMGDTEVFFNMTLEDPNTHQFSNKEYAFRVIDGTLKAVAEVQRSQNAQENRTPINPARAIMEMVSQYTPDARGWSSTLGGGIVWFKNDPTRLLVEKERPLYPNAAVLDTLDSVQLVCKSWSCPRGGLALSDIPQNVYVNSSNQEPVRYVFKKSTMLLYQVSSEGEEIGPVVFPAGYNGQGGVQIGIQRLVVASQANNEDPTLPYFRWQTGVEAWNRAVWLTDNATQQMVDFAEPLQMSYRHAREKDRDGSDRFNNAEVSLTYAGKGTLWGIPSDRGSDGMWTPRFTLKDGVHVGENNSYKIKALEGEQTPVTVGNNFCQAVGIDESQIPAIPESVDVVPVVGVRPEVLDDPKVSDGVLLVE